MHHPYRYKNELPEKTVENLGSFNKIRSRKDSVMTENGVSTE